MNSTIKKDLYASQYCSKEDENFSLQSSWFIKELVKRKKPFGVAYGFKSHCIYMNECWLKLQRYLQSRQKNQKNIFPSFGNELLSPSKYIILKGHPIIYPFKQKYICDYNPRFLMSSGLMLMTSLWTRSGSRCFNTTRKKLIVLQRLRRKTFICTGGSFKTFTGRKAHSSV